MRFGSVCSGIEAASVAWNPLGWRAAWLSEIEPFPSAVLAHHYPDVPNLGDMTALPARILLGEVEAPDIFCGGTPCQAFSVAGMRKSLDDARGNLSLTFCEIANAIDHVRAARGEQPAIVFWENVPGVLSTKDNAFGCFLAGLAGEDDPLQPPGGGKWSNAGAVYGPQRAVAWRTLDAQYFGVAQRRRRVFVVASARDDFDPATVLFEFDGLRRDSAPSREAGKTTAATLDARTKGGGFPGTDRAVGGHVVPVAFGGNNQSGPIEVATARNACASASGRMDFETETFLVQPTHTLRGEGFDASEGGTGRGTPLVPVAYRVHGEHSTAMTGNGVARVADPVEIARRLDSSGGYAANQGGNVVAQPAAFTTEQTPKFSDNCALTLTKQSPTGGGQPQAVAVAFGGDIARTLQARHDSSPCADRGMDVIATAMQVRRLTPVECERLQGFPDGYTQIPWRKKPADECPDGPRYKALGNSWAVPNVRWIGRRIDASVRRLKHANDNGQRAEVAA